MRVSSFSDSFGTWSDLDPVLRRRGAVVGDELVESPTLRPLREADATAVLAAFQSSPDLGRNPEVTSLATAQAYVAHLCHPEGPHHAFAIVDGDLLVGLVAVTVNARTRTGYLWYWMNREFRGRGWTSGAAVAIANWGLLTGLVDRLELEHRSDNPESAAIARVAGFIHEGTQRQKLPVDGGRIDVLIYGRLLSDPSPSAPSPRAF